MTLRAKTVLLALYIVALSYLKMAGLITWPWWWILLPVLTIAFFVVVPFIILLPVYLALLSTHVIESLAGEVPDA